MSLAERERAELFEGLMPKLGREVTERLVEALPPAGEPLATEKQVDTLGQRMDDRSAVTDGQFAAFDRRIEDGFAQLRAEIATQGAELLAAFRGELVTAVSGQTRAVVVATATAVFGIGGLAVTLAQVL